MGLPKGLKTNATTAEGLANLRGKADKPRGPIVIMNRWERRFADDLEAAKLAGEIRDWKFESVKLRLADRTWYTPDFAVFENDGRLRMVEIKGFWRDDAKVKYKVAREMYHHFDWQALALVRGQWVDAI